MSRVSLDEKDGFSQPSKHQQVNCKTQIQSKNDSHQSNSPIQCQSGRNSQTCTIHSTQIVNRCTVWVEHHESDFSTISARKTVDLYELCLENLQYFVAELNLCDEWEFQFSVDQPSSDCEKYSVCISCDIRGYASTGDWQEFSTKECITKLIHAVEYYLSRYVLTKEILCMRCYVRKWAKVVINQWRSKRRDIQPE